MCQFGTEMYHVPREYFAKLKHYVINAGLKILNLAQHQKLPCMDAHIHHTFPTCV